MKSTLSSRLLLTILAAVFASTLGVAAADLAQPVSPGDLKAFPLIESRCPTFSWTAIDGARGYELVAYAVPERDALVGATTETAAALLQNSQPALRMRLPARASSWTPSGGRCLEAGTSYAWAVRAMTLNGETEWSETYLFEVQNAPDAKDVREALETLERYLEQGGDTTIVQLGSLAPTASSLAAPAPLLPGTIPTITSRAISAELEDTLSATAGVEARSKSATGVALVAQNTGASGQIASFQNATNEVAKITGAGTVEAVAFVGDGSGLTNLPGGGGGSSPIALFTSNTSPPQTGGTVATLEVTAPAGGCTLVTTGTVDLVFQADDFDEPDCEIQVDSTALPGSNMKVFVDIFVTNAECVSSGGIALAAGPHTVDFVVNVSTGLDPTFPDSATLWAVCIP